MMQSNATVGTNGANPFGLLSGTLAQRNTTDAETELLIAITPIEIRVGPHPGRTLYAGRGEGPVAPAQPAPPLNPVPNQPGGENGLPPQSLPPAGVNPEGGAPAPGQVPTQPNVPPNAPDAPAPFIPPPPVGSNQGPG
jgi:hypothetical protein